MPSHPTATVGAHEHKHEVSLTRSGREIKFEIWDVAGGEIYRSLSNMYYRDADAAVLVYDVTSRESFDSIKNYWLKELLERAPSSLQIVILGNKSDIAQPHEISLKEGQEYAMQQRKLFQSASAKKNEGLNEML